MLGAECKCMVIMTQIHNPASLRVQGSASQSAKIKPKALGARACASVQLDNVSVLNASKENCPGMIRNLPHLKLQKRSSIDRAIAFLVGQCSQLEPDAQSPA